jgi:aspartate racemase
VALTVGVLGGMGPAATLDFVAKVYAADPQGVEQDRPRLIVDCNPAIPDRNAAVRGEGPSPGLALAAMARGLVAAGADFLVIACNTAHAWAPDIAAAVDAPVLSMIEATCSELDAHYPAARRIGLLAGDGCLEAGVYQRAFATRNWETLTPGADDQSAFMEALYRIKAGRLGQAEAGVFLTCARALEQAGADLVIAGCTEVPLLLGPDDLSIPLLDATQILAERTVAYARA